MSLFKDPSELEVVKTIKALLYGQPGLGKSTLALSAPSPVLLDFDGGVKRVNGAFHCPTLQVKNWDQVITAMQENLSQFETIVIDTAGKMLDFMSDFIIKNDSKMGQRDGSLSLKGYGVRKQMFINFLHQCDVLQKNIVFVAHEREEKDGELRIVRPEIGGSSAGDLIKELDLVGYMQAFGNDRAIFWTPQEKFYAKNTCNLPPMQKIPTIIDAAGNVTHPNTFLTQTVNAYKLYLEGQEEMKVEYNGLLSVIRESIGTVADAQTANEVREKISGFKVIWNSKVMAGTLLKEKCTSLGLKFNRETMQYEQKGA